MEQKINGYSLEICANSVASGKAAEAGGASRIELCQQLEVGGITPSAGQIQLAAEQLSIGVHVLIRPRAGDFVYSEDEFEEIIRDIEYCRSVGCDGVVIGALLPNGDIDVPRLERMVAAAGAMCVTFHRAFDRCLDPISGLEAIISAKCQRILTSGQKSNAYEGMEMLAKLIQLAGNRIEIMPGSGVTEDNLVEIIQKTGARSIHSSAKIDVLPTQHPPFTGWEKTWVSSKEKVRTMADLLQNL